MKNWHKKVLSLLIAIALLISAGVLAFAEEPIDTGDAEEVVLNNEEPTEAAPAQEPAPEAQDPVAEEPSNIEEGSSSEPEADPVPSYYNSETPSADKPTAESSKEEETSSNNAPVADASDKAEDKVEVTFDETIGETVYTDDEGTYAESDLTTFVDGDYGSSDQETVEELGLNVTTAMKFPNATALNVNDVITGELNAETFGEFIINWESDQVIVLNLEASSDDFVVLINEKPIQLNLTEGTEYEFNYRMTIMAGAEYHMYLISSNPVSYTLTVKDAYAETSNTEETETTEENTEAAPETNNADVNTEPEANIEDNNNEENPAEEGNGNNDGENNTVEGTIVYEFPVIKGWITIDTEAFEIDDTITLKANADTELGEMVGWQTKVQNEEGEEVWENCGYGATLTVKLTKDNINGIFRFKMEGENTSEEFQLGKVEEETEETVETTEGEDAEEEVNAVKTEEAEEPVEETVEETEENEEVDEETRKMIELGYTKIVVTAEEGADLYATADRESEVTGHLDAESKVWVLLNEDKTWGQLYTEPAAEIEETVETEADEAAEETTEIVTTSARFICMEDAADAVNAEETEETEETEQAEEETEEVDEETVKMTELGYTRIVVTAEEGADLYAAADRESEVTGHMDPETEAWVLLNEDKTWGQLYNEPVEIVEENAETEEGEAIEKGEVAEEVTEAETTPAQFISMEDAVEIDETMMELPDDRTVAFEIAWDENEAVHTFGSIAHFNAILTGYEGFVYTVQWQQSDDGKNWTDIAGATEEHMDLEITSENYKLLWRVVVFPDLEATQEMIDVEGQQEELENEEKDKGQETEINETIEANDVLESDATGQE